MAKKQCLECKSWKMPTSFYQRLGGGLHPRCKACARRRSRSIHRTGTSSGKRFHKNEEIPAFVDSCRSESAWEWGEIPT